MSNRRKCSKCNQIKERSHFTVSEWSKGEDEGSKCQFCFEMQCSKCEVFYSQCHFTADEWIKGEGIGVCNDCIAMRCCGCDKLQSKQLYRKNEWKKGEGLAICNDCGIIKDKDKYIKKCSKCSRERRKDEYDVVEWSKSDMCCICNKCLVMICGSCRKTHSRSQYNKKEWDKGENNGICHRCRSQKHKFQEDLQHWRQSATSLSPSSTATPYIPPQLRNHPPEDKEFTRKCSKCLQMKGKERYTKSEWAETEASRLCLSCSYMRCGNPKCARGGIKHRGHYRKEEWLKGVGVGICNHCLSHRRNKLNQQKENEKKKEKK